jgi:hypothetical protein
MAGIAGWSMCPAVSGQSAAMVGLKAKMETPAPPPPAAYTGPKALHGVTGTGVSWPQLCGHRRCYGCPHELGFVFDTLRQAHFRVLHGGHPGVPGVLWGTRGYPGAPRGSPGHLGVPRGIPGHLGTPGHLGGAGDSGVAGSISRTFRSRARAPKPLQPHRAHLGVRFGWYDTCGA